MSIKCMTAVWDDSPQRGAKLLIQLAIADNADDNGLGWPGLEKLAARARITRRVVISHIQEMDESGDLITFRNPGRHNYYVIPYRITQEQLRASIEFIMKQWGVDLEAFVKDHAPVLPVAPVLHKTAPVIPTAPPGDPHSTGTRATSSTTPVIPTAPDPSLNRHLEPSGEPSDSADGTSALPQPDESPAPTPVPEPAVAGDPPTLKPPTAHQAMFQAICDSQGWAIDTLTKAVKGKVGKVATELVGAGCQPEQVAPFWAWLKRKADAEGWKSVTIHAMTTYWPEYAATLRPKKVVHVTMKGTTMREVGDRTMAAYESGRFDAEIQAALQEHES